VSARCYVLGAGFSKPFGFPLASELTKQVWDRAVADVADFKPKVCNDWLSLLKIAYPSHNFKDKWPDFEDLITVLDEWDAYRNSYDAKPLAGSVGEAAHLKGVLLRHLGLLLCERLNAHNSNSLATAGQFVRHCAKACHTVVSFNWDLLLEAAAAEVSLPVSYGMVTEGERLQLAKPHGSLNLAEMSPDEWDSRKTSVNVHSLSEEFKRKDTIVIRGDDPRDAANRIIGPFGKTLLVEPTARKSYVSQWLDLQWRWALNMVREADEIVIIGFSLPVTDFRPRILLQLAGINRNPRPRFLVVDPDAKRLRGHYGQFVSDPVEAMSKGWQKWFQEVARDE
jgi:hypothetical protein